MKIYTETSIKDFDFWAGAKDTAAMLTDEEMEIIEDVLNDIYPDGLSETQLNDIFWFEPEWIAECLGFEEDPDNDLSPWEVLEASR